ncbi:ABC transporter permease [Candidatus Cytomitobacter primus]|uniref:ABC transporter permease n=1 Tax=Candidatus Cytomitobacter primus TaxID=2066024 RepID=A0A5C0UGX9_9PROT|nr:ABC transporter permease [Candidatus Cytomitobacter primus]QEK38552.1 ABC transporter permease [Candidatus Cytomitobacter primus]
MHKYEYYNDILILKGVWTNSSIPLLLKIIQKSKKVENLGNVSINVQYIIDKYNSNDQSKINYEKHQIIKPVEHSFMMKIIKMQIKLLKKIRLTVAQKEAFKDYFITDFTELGMNSVLLISIMCSVLGIAIVLESYAQLHYLGVEAFTMHFFISFALREMMPIMTAILIASKCVTSITAKISAQKINSELKMLELMNISENIVLKPKWLACILIMPLMNIYALFFSILFGTIAYSTLSNYNLIFAFNHIMEFINMPNFIISQAKSIIFGWWLGLTMCSAGILYEFGTENLGKSVVKAVIYSISGIIIFDMIVMFICTKMGV